MLRRAFFISVAVHLVALLSLRHMTQFAESESPGNVVIKAVLLAPANDAPPPASVSRSIPSAPAKPSAALAESKSRPRIRAEKPDSTASSRSTTTGDAVAGDVDVIFPHETSASTGAAVLPQNETSLDGVRQYRLNLAREARRFKRYPPLARQRGWEGVVIVLVSAVAGGPVPQVSLSQSSGYELLDQEALELVLQAVRVAAVPENLRHRQFGLALPIHYRLDD